jgi:hypothetical protein
MLICASLSCSGYNARQCTQHIIIADRGTGSVMVGKDKRIPASHHVTAITPIAIPRSALANAGASLIPSPTMATIFFSCSFSL